MALRPNEYRVGVTRREEYTELKWQTDLPAKAGMYRFAERYENGQSFSCWIKIQDGGGYLGVPNEDYVEPLKDWLDDSKVVSRHWLGPLPVPELP